MTLSNLVFFTHSKLRLEVECKEYASLADTSRVPVSAAREVSNLDPEADTPLPLESRLTFYRISEKQSVMIISMLFNAWSYFTLENQGAFDDLFAYCFSSICKFLLLLPKSGLLS